MIRTCNHLPTGLKRPWRPNGFSHSAPRPMQASSGNSRKCTSNASTVSVGRLGGLVPPRAQSSVNDPSQKVSPKGPNRPAAKPAGPSKPTKPAGDSKPKPAKPQTAVAGATGPPATPDFVLCKGDCQLQSAQSTTMIDFEMKIDARAHIAQLVLMFPDNVRKVYDVLNLKDPTIEDGSCIVTTMDASVTYRLSLGADTLTKDFKSYLGNLRQAIIRQKARNAKASISSPVVAQQPVAKVPCTPGKPVGAEVEPLIATSFAPTATALTKTATGSRPTVPVSSPHEPGSTRSATHQLACLKDFGGQIATGRASESMRNVEERLNYLVRRLIPGFAGHELSEKESEGLSGDYVKLVQTLEGMERKLALQREGKRDKAQSRSSSLASLKELDRGQSGTPLRYTLDEMKSFNMNPTPRTKRLENGTSLSNGSSSVGKPLAKSASTLLPNFRECRDWLLGASPSSKSPAEATDARAPQSTGAAAPTFPPAQLGWEGLVAGTLKEPISSSEPMDIGGPPWKSLRDSPKIDRGDADSAPMARAAEPPTASFATKTGPERKGARPGLGTSRWAQ